MSISIIKKIKKNILTLNIILICIAGLYYYFNKNKFDTFKTEIIYSFQEKVFFTSSYPNAYFTNDKIKFFLNDLDFNKKFYEINDLKHANSNDKIKVKVDHNSEKLNFSFVIKKENFFLDIIRDNDNKKNLINKNVEIIDQFINKSLNKFHSRVYESMSNQKKIYQKKLDDFIELESTQENKSERTKIEIAELKNSILEISNFTSKKSNLIIVSDYSKKFRQLHLNTNEYMLSILLILFLGNILIRNFDKVLK
jgi:hypothetical protein